MIECRGEQLLLHPAKALLWPQRKTLFVADVHAGKEHVFARSGIPIPVGISETNLITLMRLVDQSAAERLIVLGDFMHAVPFRSERWLTVLSNELDQRRSLEMWVVAGNHDRTTGQTRVDSRIKWLNEAIVEAPFVYQHEPASDPRGYVLSGHIHPAFRLSQSKRNSICAPVFHFKKDYAVLPAFGTFTGGHVVKPKQGDGLYMTGPDCIIPVPADYLKRRRSIADS